MYIGVKFEAEQKRKHVTKLFSSAKIFKLLLID